MYQEPKAKIALFVGSDIVAHREMCDVVAHIHELGMEPVLYYPAHLASKSETVAHNAGQPILKDYVYVERLILRETVFPFLENDPYVPANDSPVNPPFLTPSQVATRYGMQPPVDVANINDPAFFEPVMNDPMLAGVISLRCTQIFRPEICKAVHAERQPDGRPRFMLNLHSGVLPQWRGLYSTPRAIAHALKKPSMLGDFGATLHHIEPFRKTRGKLQSNIDDGNIVDSGTMQIDPNATAYATNIWLAAIGAQAVNRALDKLAQRQSITGYPQLTGKANYYSVPNAGEIAEWQNLGLTMQRPDEVVSILRSTFMGAADPRSVAFENTLTKAIAKRFDIPEHVDLASVDLDYSGPAGQRRVLVRPQITKGAAGYFNRHVRPQKPGRTSGGSSNSGFGNFGQPPSLVAG